ncbi:MAG: rhodanese-like domain-containing protein [Nonlabens sp.]
MKNILLIMALFGSFFGSNAQDVNNSTILTAAEFKEAVYKGNVQLIDVRTAEEFEAGAIKGARNLDYFQQDAF